MSRDSRFDKLETERTGSPTQDATRVAEELRQKLNELINALRR